MSTRSLPIGMCGNLRYASEKSALQQSARIFVGLNGFISLSIITGSEFKSILTDSFGCQRLCCRVKRKFSSCLPGQERTAASAMWTTRPGVVVEYQPVIARRQKMVQNNYRKNKINKKNENQHFLRGKRILESDERSFNLVDYTVARFYLGIWQPLNVFISKIANGTYPCVTQRDEGFGSHLNTERNSTVWATPPSIFWSLL